MLRGRIIVEAMWDAEAGVFVATSDDVPGLITEASTFEALQTKLNEMIPELLAMNGGDDPCPADEAEMVVEHRSRVRLRA